VRLLNTIEEKEFHFSHTQFAVFCFLLVKKLIDKKNPVIFHDFEPVYKNIRKYKPKTINNFKVITTCILLRILYRLPLEIRESVKNSYIISLKQNYIHNSATQINNVKYIYFKETLQMFKSVDLNYPIINNLFIAQNIDPRFYKQDSVQKIIKIINNKNVTVKMHPKLGAVEGLNKCTILPEFLPVELFFNKVNTVVISIHSASLITASHFDNIKVISLIDIVSNKDPFIFKVKNELQKLSNNKIIFPKTICEFLKLIK